MSSRVVAIHQPNFFPWLGYFDKLHRADVFIVLDHVQFPKPRGNWSNRVKIVANGEPRWATMPVEHGYEGFKRIDEICVDQATPWRRKLVNLLQPNYARAEAFGEVFPDLKSWIEHPVDRLADYNLHAITAICGKLALPVDHLVRSSTLGIDGGKSDLLVELIKSVGGTTYLSGDGAGEYMQDELFNAAGIAVTYQRFVHPVYPRGAEPFTAGLSTIDALLHCGYAKTAAMIRAGGAP